MKVNRKRGLVATVVAVVVIVLAVTGLVGADVGQPYRSSSDVRAFADPRTLVGESTLRRTDDEVRMKLRRHRSVVPRGADRVVGGVKPTGELHQPGL